MSQYSCIVPVDWKAVSEVVVPAWLRTVDGWETATLPFEADRVRFGSTQMKAGTLVVNAIDAFAEAIILGAAVDLTGHDPFANEPWDGYYSRLHWAPGVQVAGTKNCFHFLEVWFDVDHVDEVPVTPGSWRSVYRHRPKGRDRALERLLGALCLGIRTVPGVEVLGEPSAWPASDDPWLAGYLLPHEVRELATLLDRRTDVEETSEYELYPLFVDRVSRAASEGRGLFAFHGFLFWS